MAFAANRRALLWLPTLSFLALFFFLPYFRILTYGLGPDALSAPNLGLALQTLLFTFYQAVLSTLLTLVIGLPSAVLFAHYDFPAKSLLRALTAVPFMLPTVVVAAGFNALLGPRGWLNLTLMGLLELSTPPVSFVGTLGAILAAHVFYNTSIVIRIVGNALSSLDPRLGQAARSLGADSPRVWWHVVLPLLRPSLLAAGLLVFLFDFTSFGVILLLGGPSFSTMEVQIYLQALQLLNLPLASLLASIQLMCTLIFSILYTRFATRRGVQTAPHAGELNLHRSPTRSEKLFVSVMLALLFVFFILPMLALPLRSVWRLDAARGDRTQIQTGFTADYYTELFVNRRDSVFYVPPARAAGNSLAYGAATVVLSLAFGFPAASALAKPGRLEKILDPVLIVPLGASAVTLGLGFILAFARWLAHPWLVPLAHTLVALPFVIRALQPALAAIPERLRQAAASLGASPFRAWQNVDWPILRRATLSAASFAFTISLGEFGATSLLSRPEYPTIPIAIYRFLSQPGGLNYGQAMAMATLLMILTTLGIFLIEQLRAGSSRILMLELRNIRKEYEGQVLLDGISFKVGQHETVCILGPSGSGKSTLLRLIAGLEWPEAGKILWAGRDLTSVPSYRRDFGLVFQDYALFPHLDVFDNVAFGLRMRNWAHAETTRRVAEVMGLVNLVGFEHRGVTDLSGGEQQRVALARALGPNPRLLMFDEPLGALDRALREGLLHQLRAILRQTGKPAIYVTHDQDEAFTIADRVLLLHAGQIVRAGMPSEVRAHPGSVWAAEFLDLGNILPGEVLDARPRVQTQYGIFAVKCEHTHQVGDQIYLLARPGAAGNAVAIQGVVRDVVLRQDQFRAVLQNGLHFDLPRRPTIGRGITVKVRLECLGPHSEGRSTIRDSRGADPT